MLNHRRQPHTLHMPLTHLEVGSASIRFLAMPCADSVFVFCLLLAEAASVQKLRTVASSQSSMPATI